MPSQNQSIRKKAKRSSKKAATVPTVKSSTIQPVRQGINPQLCKVFNPDKHDWSKSWMVEPKFDGLRCIVIVNHGKANAYSRNGKPLWNLDLILKEIELKCPIGQALVLDGEVYSKDWNLSMSIVKRSTQTHPDQDKLCYHIWDCLTFDEWDDHWIDNRKVVHPVYSAVSNLERKQRLLWLDGGTHIELVRSTVVANQEEFTNAYTTFLDQGYEGIIVKWAESPYEGGRRSPYWLKLKPWSDADLTVVGAYAGEGKHLGRLGGFVLEGEAEWNGSNYTVHTEVGTGFTDAERETFQKMWDEDTLNGHVVEIQFQDITEEGACRFPVFHRLRTDKE